MAYATDIIAAKVNIPSITNQCGTLDFPAKLSLGFTKTGLDNATMFKVRTTEPYSETFGGAWQRWIKANPQDLGLPIGSTRTVPISEKQRLNWLFLNWVMRPPLLSDEIRLMPLVHVVPLYYSLYNARECDVNYASNPMASAGLPEFAGLRYASQYEIELQKRIYAIRTDLHFVTDSSGKQWPILIEPKKLQAPRCDEDANAIQAISAFVSVLTWGATAWVTILITIATTVASAYDQANQLKIIAQSKGMAKNILTGVALARDSMPNPVPDAATIGRLQKARATWKRYCDAAYDIKDLLWQWREMPVPERWLALGASRMETTGKRRWVRLPTEQYITSWHPYESMFYSNTVAKLVS